MTINNTAIVTQAQLKDPCKGCNFAGLTSWCCNQIWLEIPAYKDTDEICFDSVHFYLTRPNIHAVMYSKKGEVSFKRDRWELMLTEKCQYLQSDGKCGIYEFRPVLCAGYSPLPTQRQKRPCPRYDRSAYDMREFHDPFDFIEFVKKERGYDFFKERDKINSKVDMTKVKVNE